MKMRIVRRYTTPCYPTRQYLMEHPELLQWIPERWRQHRLVLGVLSMVIPLIISKPAVAGDSKNTAVDAPRVAPLFIHGEGRGGFGCVAVNPPVFLSEDEARQVVQDEAKKAGIDFSADALTLKDMMVPVTDQFGFLDERDENTKERKQKPNAQKRDLVLDGYDKQHDVAYQVVTRKDFADWETKDHTRSCSVSSFDFKTTAQVLTNGLNHTKGKTIVAVFYDPAASAPKMDYPKKEATDTERRSFWEARQKAAKDIGEKELREQVQDFVKWLKGQGVI
jgi:hypothetical protein